MQEKRRGRIAKKDPIAIIHAYIDSEIYKKIQAQAEKKYTSMAAIVREVVGKMVKESV